MVEDELLVGKSRRKPCGIGKLAREHHQVEGEPVGAKQGQAGAPRRLVHDTVAGGEAPENMEESANEL